MQYRTIGKTGLRVSEIGFGCGNNAVLMVKAPHQDQVKAVRHALDAGINFFDTAFAYGLGKSEENLGRILHELGAEPVVSTKIRLEADAVADLQAATVRAVEAGLSRLGRDRVDFVQLHTRVTLDRGMGKRFSLTPKDVLGPNGVIDGFKSMRDRGKVGFFGFSGLGDPKALHELVDSGEFHGFQCYYNLLNPSAGQPVPTKLQCSRLRANPRSRCGQRNGRFRHPRFGGRCADFGSEHRRRWQRPNLVAGFGLPAGSATRGKSQSRARSGRKKSHPSSDSLRLDE